MVSSHRGTILFSFFTAKINNQKRKNQPEHLTYTFTTPMHMHIGGDYCVLWEENYDNQALRIIKWQQKQKNLEILGSQRVGWCEFRCKS